MSSGGRTPGTQHLTALASPEELVDWRLVVCYETAHVTGMLDGLPATAAQIAAACDLDADAVRPVLSVLVAWGHLRVDPSGVFSAGPQWLEPAGRAALAQHGTWIRRWASLVPRRVRERQATAAEDLPAPDPVTGLALLESASRPFIEPVAEVCLSALATTEDEPARVLDLGGGHGAYARELAQRGCRVTMQDLPGVIDLARADGRLTAAGVELVAADAFDDIAPGPFDLVLCGTFTNMFSLDRVRDLLTRIRGVLAPGGQLAIVTWLRDHGPVGAAFGVQMLVATPSGDAHGEADYRRVLFETGYTDVRFADVARPALSVLLAITDRS